MDRSTDVQSAGAALEGMATFAMEMAFSQPERLRFERDQLFPLAGLNPHNTERDLRAEQLAEKLRSTELAIARDYLDGKLEWARAATALEDRAAMAHPEETLKYINEYREATWSPTRSGGIWSKSM